jgi:hypothetical protein
MSFWRDRSLARGRHSGHFAGVVGDASLYTRS